jgi:hypothetical protein
VLVRRYLRKRRQRKVAPVAPSFKAPAGQGRSSRHRSRRGTDGASAPIRSTRLSRGASRSKVGLVTTGEYVPAPVRPSTSTTGVYTPAPARNMSIPSLPSGTVSTTGYTPGPLTSGAASPAYTPGPVEPIPSANMYTAVPTSFTGAQKLPKRPA